jgi:hypothetical protein
VLPIQDSIYEDTFFLHDVSIACDIHIAHLLADKDFVVFGLKLPCFFPFFFLLGQDNDIQENLIPLGVSSPKLASLWSRYPSFRDTPQLAAGSFIGTLVVHSGK